MNDRKQTVLTLELTADERDFLASILHQAIGGPDPGLRNIGDAIQAKLTDGNANRYRCTIEQVSTYGSMGVVVSDEKIEPTPTAASSATRVIAGVVIPTWPKTTAVLRVDGQADLLVLVGDLVE